MTDPKTIAENYVALWNTTDPDARLARLEQEWTAEATYSDPLMNGTGAKAISEMIAAVHQTYFPAFAFSLVGEPEATGDHVRFTWGLGPKDAKPVARGTDFVRVEDGRIAQVTGFLDLVPAAA